MACDIMVVKIGQRRERSPEVQEVLSKFGCSIKVRLGLHETENVCSDEGILVLQLTGETEEMLKLENALNEMKNIKAKNGNSGLISNDNEGSLFKAKNLY